MHSKSLPSCKKMQKCRLGLVRDSLKKSHLQAKPFFYFKVLSRKNFTFVCFASTFYPGKKMAPKWNFFSTTCFRFFHFCWSFGFFRFFAILVSHFFHLVKKRIFLKLKCRKSVSIEIEIESHFRDFFLKLVATSSWTLLATTSLPFFCTL